MADYIDSSIICESYLYVSSYELTPEKRGRILSLLQEYARTRAPLFFEGELDFDVDVIEGSLKAKTTIYGSIAGLILFYGNIRQSIDYIYKDAQFVASGLVTESIFAAGVRRPQVTRVEVRTGLPGVLKRVLKRLDALAEEKDSISPNDFSLEMAGIRAELKRILETIQSEEDKDAVAKGFEHI